MFEDLPVKLSQQEERMLQAIVIPEVTNCSIRSCSTSLRIDPIGLNSARENAVFSR